jgi:hypothetical protein
MDVVVEKKRGGLELQFELAGFITQHATARSGESTLAVLDWLTLVGGLVDLFFVNRLRYKPNPIHVNLREQLNRSPK